MPTRSMMRYAILRATVDRVATAPMSSAPNRNQAVSLAKPLNAVGNLTTPSAQNRKQPINPARANSMAHVAHATTMNAAIAKPCFVTGSSGRGANHTPNGTRTQRICPIMATGEFGFSSGSGERRAGASAAVMDFLHTRAWPSSFGDAFQELDETRRRCGLGLRARRPNQVWGAANAL